MIRVKICGITDPADAAMCVEEGADALGFVVEFPQENPWNLPRRRAVELMRVVPPFVTRVAIVGGDADWITAIAESTGAHALQLHRDEPEEVVAEVARRLAGRGTTIVKALRIDPTDPGPAARWCDQAARFLDAGADAILLDTKAPGRPAGSGLSFDWAVARAVVASRPAPFVLAGGLRADNVASAVATVRPFAVDVITSVEDGEHRKVRERVRAFIRAARSRPVVHDPEGAVG